MLSHHDLFKKVRCCHSGEAADALGKRMNKVLPLGCSAAQGTVNSLLGGNTVISPTYLGGLTGCKLCKFLLSGNHTSCGLSARAFRPFHYVGYQRLCNVNREHYRKTCNQLSSVQGRAQKSMSSYSSHHRCLVVKKHYFSLLGCPFSLYTGFLSCLYLP